MGTSQTGTASAPKKKSVKKVTLISECGINHNGSFSMAVDQIQRSAKAGADVAKFQLYDPYTILKGVDPDIVDYASRCQFSKEQLRELAAHCKANAIEFMCSPFHPWAVDFLEGLKVRRYKVASRTVPDLETLKAINGTQKPVFMSTGMSKPDDVKKALDTLRDCDVTLLYCVARYPTAPADFNFAKLFRLHKDHARPVGFSSHCPSIWPAVKAVALGAVVVEQHTTISRELEGCDQSSSLTYEELAELASAIRSLEKVG